MLELAPYLQALGTGPQPATTLKWMARSPGYETVIELEVAEADMGKVIGKHGRTVKALRAVLERELDSITRASERLPWLTTQLPEYERARVDEHFRFGLELMLDGIAARKTQT